LTEVAEAGAAPAAGAGEVEMIKEKKEDGAAAGDKAGGDKAGADKKAAADKKK
jgi:hypothetical protein